jgi:eukaryotic-like serine/threonine-protein kinase
MTIGAGTRMGRYEIRALLGAGGMGEVYSAHDDDLDRDVAIKVLRHGDETSERVHRFIQEARAASALNHPNVAHVYEVGTQDGVRFIVMEMVAGETLRSRIARGPLSLDDALEIGTQITTALAAAHNAGIVHRDIKPENVIIRPDGYAKVLDFGLAKLREPATSQDGATVVKTATGIAMGTFGYMAPEQLSGGQITAAADVYSLGVVLYEMVHGVRPPAAGLGSRASSKLDAIIAKALTSDPNRRYQNAGEMLEDLRAITRENRVRSAEGGGHPLRWWWVVAAVVIVAVAGGWIWRTYRAALRRNAERIIANAQRLVDQRQYVDAYEAARAAESVIPADDRVRDVIGKTTQSVSITSEPSGATVYLQRFKGPVARVRAGTTPLKLPRLIRADYLVTVEKDGYEPVTRPLSIAPMWFGDIEVRRMPGTLQVQLLKTGQVPPGMVFVGRGPYRLQAWYRASDRTVNLQDFFIDRYEVSNALFARFVRDGGYRRPEFWKDLPIPFEAAMARFHDTTGLPGPRSWAGGAPPAGRENDPVADVTWYEASALAQWSGKKLPTIFQWEKAGRYPGTRGAATSFPWGFVAEGVDVTERANFLGKGTVPVDSMPFGMSTWGAQHMAGNVSEWVRNAKPPGHAARGGSWNDATYAFGRTAAFPEFYSSPTLGFRCVKEIAAGDDGDFPLTEKEVVPVYRAVDDRAFDEIRKSYEYAHTPLNARVIETRDTPDWTRQKIAFDVAGKTVIAYLFLPKGFQPPFQVIDFAPAGDVESGLRSLAASMESKLAGQLRGGRAIFAVAMEGYIDRPRAGQFEVPDTRTTEYVEYIVSRVTELRRALDYLESRHDIDASRIAFEADSAGTDAGVILCGLDNRYRSVMFVGSGVDSQELADAAPANRINFLPHIASPKFMLQGRYDESSPYASSFEPLYKLLREPKRELIYEGPHVPPQDVYLRESQKWFDDTLGKVK